MNLHSIDITIIAAYLLICLLIGFMKFGKIRNIRDYTLGTKPFTTSVLVATTFATFVGSKQIIGNIGKVYELGLVFIIPLFLTPVAWFIISKAFAPNLQKFHELKFMSLGDIMDHWYGKTGRIIANILSVFVVMSVSATSTIAIGYLLHYFVGIPELWGMVIGVSIVTLYSTFGGINSVAFTDVFQFIIFFIALPISCFIGYEKSGGIDDIIKSLPENHLNINSSNFWFFLSLIFYSISPYTGIPYIQRALIAKDKEQFKSTFVGVGFLFIPFLLVISLVGLLVYQFDSNLNSNVILYYFIDNYLSTGIKGLMVAGVLAIIMSTQDSYLNTVSAVIARDFFKYFWCSISEKQELLIARLACIFISMLSIILVFFKLNIIDIIWLSQNFWMPLVTFPLLGGLFGVRISKKTFHVLILVSLASTIIVRSFTGAFDTRSLVAGVIASILVLYIGNKKYKKQHPELVQKKTLSESLTIRLKRSLFSGELPTQSLYIVTVILCAGFIIGCGFLGFQQLNVFNVTFVCISTILLLLLLSDMWSLANKVTLCIWQFTFIVSFVLLPSYILVVSGFSILGILNFILSLVLFSVFTNRTKAILLGCVGIVLSYFVKVQGILVIDSELIDTKKLFLLYTVLIVVSLAVTIYQSKYVSQEVVKQLEKKVAERTSELKKALYAKQEFLDKLSHEVRTPIHNIIGIASGLSDGWMKYSEKERKKYVDMVSENADRLMNYTSNILDLASIKQNKFILKKKDGVNAVNIAEEMVGNANALILARNKKLKIKLEVQNSVPLVSCDPIKFGQILSNLLDNAIKYSDKGEIFIELKKKTSQLVLQVSDFGIGIPEAEKGKIFEAFYESSRTNTNAEGKGLGLAIVKEFVSLHNGTIKVEDNQPKGSVFIVELPLK